MHAIDKENYVRGSPLASAVNVLTERLGDKSPAKRFALTRALERLQKINERCQKLNQRVAFVWSRADSPTQAVLRQDFFSSAVRTYLPNLAQRYFEDLEFRRPTSDPNLYYEIVIGYSNLLKRAQQQTAFCERFLVDFQNLQESHAKQFLTFQKAAVYKLDELWKRVADKQQQFISFMCKFSVPANFAKFHANEELSCKMLAANYQQLTHQIFAPGGLRDNAVRLAKDCQRLRKQVQEAPECADKLALMLYDMSETFTQHHNLLNHLASLQKKLPPENKGGSISA